MAGAVGILGAITDAWKRSWAAGRDDYSDSGSESGDEEGFVDVTQAPPLLNTLPHYRDPAPAPPNAELNSDYQNAASTNFMIPLPQSVAESAAPLAGGKGVVMNPPGDERPPVYNTTPVVSQLSGLVFAPGEFTHNNMVPFFAGASSKQNMRDATNTAKLQLFTGTSHTMPRQRKVEQGPMFDTGSQPYGNPYGMPSITSFQQDRAVAGRYYNGQKPFEPERVGPGVGMGYGTEGTGGFQQAYAGEIAREGTKTVNELRPGNRPKEEYEGRFLPAVAIAGRRGMQGLLSKNRPDTVIYNVDGRYNGPAISAELRETQRPIQVLHETTRAETTTDYGGIAGPGDGNEETYTTGSYREPHTIQLGEAPIGPADGTQYGVVDTDAENADYGRSGIEFLPNERSETVCRTHTIGVGTAVPAGQSNYLDQARATRKQTMIDNPQEAGYLSPAMPPKPVVYDPNDVPRTTVKETNIHNTRTGVMATGVVKGVVKDPRDVARTTVKQTTINPVHEGMFAPTSGARGIVYDQAGVTPRTTIRETTADDGHLGVVVGPIRGTVYDPAGTMRTTVRETTADDGHLGIARGPIRTVVYDPESVARSTLRQTLEEVDPWLNLGPAESGGAPTLGPMDPVRETQKSQLSNHSYIGGAGNAELEMPRSRAAEMRAHTNSTKEKITRMRSPTRTSVKLIAGAGDYHIAAPRKPQSDVFNNYIPTQTRVLGAGAQRADLGVMYQRNVPQLPYRYGPEIVSVLANNPLAKNLASNI